MINGKFLVDQNISFRLISWIENKFGDVQHVQELGLKDADDFQIFQFARKEKFDAIITLDSDFNNMQLEHGAPPKIIWIRAGNCSTRELANVVLRKIKIIDQFMRDPKLEVLEILH